MLWHGLCTDFNSLRTWNHESVEAITMNCAGKEGGLITMLRRKQSSAAAPIQAPAGSQRGRRLLLVDDDVSVRDSLKDLLVDEGYSVVAAADGQQAVDLAGAQEVALVLLDLNMPIKNGWDTFEQLTREHPLLPIIIITARPNQVFTALSAGAGALLEKPIDIPTLLGAIEKLLAEGPEQRLFRLTGKRADFFYRPGA